MPNKTLNARIAAYKAAFADGELQRTYQDLVSVVQQLRTDFAKQYQSTYSVANILHGYIDFTYFYLQNDYLKQRKLKFAIVFNHQRVHFELWLLGQTKDVQTYYWQKLRNLKWVNRDAMPQYSIFETPLLSAPDFDHVGPLAQTIQRQFEILSEEILSSLAAYE